MSEGATREKVTLPRIVSTGSPAQSASVATVGSKFRWEDKEFKLTEKQGQGWGKTSKQYSKRYEVDN